MIRISDGTLTLKWNCLVAEVIFGDFLSALLFRGDNSILTTKKATAGGQSWRSCKITSVGLCGPILQDWVQEVVGLCQLCGWNFISVILIFKKTSQYKLSDTLLKLWEAFDLEFELEMQDCVLTVHITFHSDNTNYKTNVALNFAFPSCV